MQKYPCFVALFSLVDILACPFPFVSLALFRQQLHLCCYLVVVCYIALSRVSFDFLSGLVTLCYQFGYLFCPVWFVLMYVTPRDGLLCSVFDGITYVAVVLVRVFPNCTLFRCLSDISRNLTKFAFLWRRSGSAVECRNLDREDTVSNPPHIWRRWWRLVVAVLPSQQNTIIVQLLLCNKPWFL